MVIKKEGVSGTLEKSDAYIRVLPNEAGREIEIRKIPHPRFLERETAYIGEILDRYDIKNVRVEVQDFGALDFVIEARLITAIEAAGGTAV